MPHELEILDDIPGAALYREKIRREKALEKYLEYKEKCLQDPDTEHPKYDIRIWWKNPETSKSNWVKRLPLPGGQVLQWRTIGLSDQDLERVMQNPPDSDCRTPGNKVLVENRAYIRLMPGLGHCVFAGDQDLPGHYILGQYVGYLYCDDPIAAHVSGPTDTHKFSLRHRATMPGTVSGINGGPVEANGKQYDLRYYWQNGAASLFNSTSRSESSCMFLVEYPNTMMYSRAPQLFVDDEYCRDDVPYCQRVLSPK